jgi:uncharacterized RDD family membrane protein YckC
MFTIIGGDGKEYGPVTTDQVRSWIANGRANLDTKAKAAGSDEWRRLADFPEFGNPAGLPPVISDVSDIAHDDQLAAREARIGAALLNALVYFLGMIPGLKMMHAEMLRQNPDLARGAFVRVADLDLVALREGLVYAWVGLLVVMFIQFLLLGFRGQNLGKLAVRARVVRASDGAPAGFVRAGLLRFILPVTLFFFLNQYFLLGFVFLFVDLCFMFGAERRCLHDLIAGTKVAKR